MYPRIPLEQVADPMGSAEHTLRTTAVECSYAWLLNHVTDDDHYQRENSRPTHPYKLSSGTTSCCNLRVERLATSGKEVNILRERRARIC